MINTKPVLGDMRLNVTDNLGKYEVFNGETWLIMENYDTIESLRAEIEALKKDNKELHAIAQRMAMAESDARKSLQWFKDAKEMNNESVAWMSVGLDGRTVLANYEFETAIPLYTHPVKELTDAEIRTIQDMCHLKNVGYNTFIMRFARAILRKAQEK
jgi:FtsZ-binding cell division protein ZapB